jgi:putative peptidoglycan lipid II flippase
LLPPTAALGIRYKFVLNPRHPSIGKLVRVGGPLLLYLVVANGSSLLERHLASHLPGGALSTISYATRLFIIPSNFLAAPLAIVAYPRFALEALNEHYGDLSFQVTRTLRAVCFVFLPVSVWIVLNALPLTRLLYERGQFSMEDSIITSRVLTLYAIGVLPNAITVILLRCFYAIQDTLTPLWVESLDLLFYLAVASFLTNRYGITGLALTRGLQFILVATLLLIVLWRRRKLLTINTNFCGFLLRTAVAASVMASVSWITLQLLRAVFNAGGTSLRLVIVSGAMLTSAISFWAMARAFKIPEAVYILNLVVATVPRTQMQLRMCRQFFNDKLRCRTL